MKKYYLLPMLLLLSIWGFSQMVDVTFQVDMNQVVLDNGRVSPNGVHVAGSFQGWMPGDTQLSDPENDGIYSVTVSIANGAAIEYKFVNDNDWGADEGNNRTYTVNDADGNGMDTIPLVCFNVYGMDGTGCATVGVVFRVDLNDEIVSGNFDPATGTVSVAGSFQGWTPEATPLTDPDGDNIYTAVVDIAAGTAIQYKFVIGSGGWENNVGGCNGSQDGNRAATVQANTVLPVVCYNKCGPCELLAPPSKFLVTFQVDFSNMIAQFGAIDTAYVAGAFQGWSPGVQKNALTDPDGDGIYTGVDSVLAGTYQFKYIYGDNWGFDETGLGTLPCGQPFGGNRQFTVEDADVVLEPYCFNTCDVGCPTLPDAINLTLFLDLSDEIPSASGVFVKGSFQWPQFTDGSEDFQLESIGGGIYKTDPIRVIPGEVTFQFSNGNQSANNENALFATLGCGVINPVGEHLRLLDLDGVTQDTAVGYVWNSCSTIASTRDISTIQGLRVYPNPFSHSTVIEFENTSGAVHHLVITDITGKVVRLENNIRDNRIEISREGMPAGMYFATLRNNRGERTTQKLIVQ